MRKKVKVIRKALSLQAVRCSCLSTPVSCNNEVVKAFANMN